MSLGAMPFRCAIRTQWSRLTSRLRPTRVVGEPCRCCADAVWSFAIRTREQYWFGGVGHAMLADSHRSRRWFIKVLRAVASVLLVMFGCIRIKLTIFREFRSMKPSNKYQTSQSIIFNIFMVLFLLDVQSCFSR